MKIGLVYLQSTGPIPSENILAFKTYKKMFAFIGKHISTINEGLDVKLRKGWKIKKFPNGRSYENKNIKIVCKKTTFTKLKGY